MFDETLNLQNDIRVYVSYIFSLCKVLEKLEYLIIALHVFVESEGSALDRVTDTGFLSVCENV